MFKKSSDKTKHIFVVSGLPRSGTSMMMKMLIEGGLEAVTDSQRPADDDNPNGYFEFEPVKQLADGQDAWLKAAQGRVVKVISHLLEHLPATYHYKVIFMERSLPEVLVSQKKMLEHRNASSTTSDQNLEQISHKHLAAIKYWLARQPNFETLYMRYNALLASPDEHSHRVADFIGVPMDVEKMRKVPNEDLYRNRASARN